MKPTHLTEIKLNQRLAANGRRVLALAGVLVACVSPVHSEEVAAGFGLASPVAEALVLNESMPIEFDDASTTLLGFEVDEPGLLTVVFMGEPEGDSVLMVTDDLGQQLYNGYLDWDASDAPGGEYGAIALAKPGVYFVAMRSWDGQANGKLFASFQPMDGFTVEVDPQGRPDEALPIGVGVPVQQTLNTDAGDDRDWYRFESSRDGVVSFRSRVPNGSEMDLALEVFTEQDFAWPAAEGDLDEDDLMGNESVDFEVAEGEVIYVRVNGLFSEGESPYTLDARWQD